MNKTNLFLLSAPRCGSTQLAAWLNSHSEIGCTFVKEPNYFSQHEFSEEYVKSTHLNDIDPSKLKDLSKHAGKSYQFAIYRKLSDYQTLVDSISESWKMDASTTYLHSIEAIDKINSYNPNAKFIVLVRDPVARMISHYRLAIRTGREVMGFEERLKKELADEVPLESKYLLRQSLYFESIKHLIDTKKPDDLKFVVFEKMIKDPNLELSNIAEFLGVSGDAFNISVSEQNEGVAPRFSSLNRFLAKSGFKTYLRSILPKSLKKKLKRFYFSDKKVEVDVGAVSCVKENLVNDRKLLSEVLPEVSSVWRGL